MEKLPFELMYLLLKMIIRLFIYHLGNSFFIYHLDSFG